MFSSEKNRSEPPFPSSPESGGWDSCCSQLVAVLFLECFLSLGCESENSESGNVLGDSAASVLMSTVTRKKNDKYFIFTLTKRQKCRIIIMS